MPFEFTAVRLGRKGLVVVGKSLRAVAELQSRLIAAQQAIVRDGEARREKHRQQWMVKRQRLESLSRAVDRFCNTERIAEERREQRELDDAAPRPDALGKPAD